MEPKEPGLNQSEQQEFSPFAEKIRTLLQEFLDQHQEEFSENKIQEKVNRIVELKKTVRTSLNV